jgi:hypothetical protein
MKRLLAAAAVLLSAPALTACGGGDDDRAAPDATSSPSASVVTPSAPVVTPDAPGETPDASSPVVTPSAPPATSGDPTQAPPPASSAPPRTARPGTSTSPQPYTEPVEYDDGMLVEIPGAAAHQASPFATGAESTNGEIAVFTVQITNNGSRPVDLSQASVTATYGAGNRAASPVQDFEQGFGTGSFTPSLAPGQFTTADFAFAVPVRQLGSVMLAVRPEPSGAKQTAVFTGPIE